jgi:hypothetical protein
MSAVIEILEELSRRGVEAQADGETIRLKPRAPLDDALLARVKEHKPQILAALSRRPALCSPTCWHCGGTGECSCITCGHLERHAEWKAGPCVPCRQKKRTESSDLQALRSMNPL